MLFNFTTNLCLNAQTHLLVGRAFAAAIPWLRCQACRHFQKNRRGIVEHTMRFNAKLGRAVVLKTALKFGAQACGRHFESVALICRLGALQETPTEPPGEIAPGGSVSRCVARLQPDTQVRFAGLVAPVAQDMGSAGGLQ